MYKLLLLKLSRRSEDLFDGVHYAHIIQGMGKVGTASDQPFIRRVHLAVGAYIRHTYTDYDRLLKSHGYLNARTMVEPSTLDKIIEWRDEKDDPDAVEDILREVVVISDDEDEDNVDDFFDDGGSSVEIASSCEITDEVHVQPIHYGTLDKSSRIQRPVSPEDDWAPSVKFIRRLSTPQERIVRHHAQRYQKWQEAISRRKHAVNSGHDYIDEPTNLTGAGLRSSRNHPYQPKGVDHTNGGYYLKPVGHAIAGENDAFKPATRMVLDQHRRSGMDNVSKSLPLVIPPCIAMGTDAQRKPWKSFESSRLRSEQLDLQDSPSYPAIHYTPRPIHEMHGTKETVGRDYSIPQRQAARTQGFSIHQPVYFEPETLIPSVESDPHIPKRQEQHLGSNGPVATQRQLHGHFSGPRIVGPDDDPTSPVHKRRRVVGDGFPSPKVMYSTHGDHNHSVLVPRNQSIYGIHPTSEQSRNALPPSEASWYGQQTQHTMGSAPVAGRVHRVPNDGPMRGDGQNRTGLMAQENRVPGMFPGMRSEYQQRVPSPSMQSSRFEGFVPPGQVSHRFPSGSNPAIEMHESSRSPRPVYSGSAALYAEKHLPNVERVRFIQPVERGWQEMSSRLKPSHPVDHNHGAYTYDRPEMDRTHGREIDSILSKAEAPSPLSHPPSQHREHGSNVVSFPRLSKLDCPMAVRGSFCNRVGQNGFTREDHCREHLRLVHRYDTGQAGEMDQGRIIGPPQVQNGGQFASQYSDTSAEERHKERPPDWQRNGHHRSAQEREVVYITSSPLRGEG